MKTRKTVVIEGQVPGMIVDVSTRQRIHDAPRERLYLGVTKMKWGKET
jgi:hypothetical protein